MTACTLRGCSRPGVLTAVGVDGEPARVCLHHATLLVTAESAMRAAADRVILGTPRVRSSASVLGTWALVEARRRRMLLADVVADAAARPVAVARELGVPVGHVRGWAKALGGG